MPEVERDIDDRAGFLPLHHRQHVLAGEKHGGEIHIELRVPNLLAHLRRPAGRRAADIVDEDIDAAEAIDAGFHHGGDRGAVGDVALMHDDVAADGFDFVDGFGGAFGIAVDGKDFRAFLGEAHAGGAAVAPAGPDRARAGDDGDPVLQTLGHVRVTSSSARRRP